MDDFENGEIVVPALTRGPRTKYDMSDAYVVVISDVTFTNQ